MSSLPKPRGITISLPRVSLCALALMMVGCPAQPKISLAPAPPRPLFEVASLVNENAHIIKNTLRARGVVDGYFTSPKGQLRNYHVDGTLFYLPPSYLRFDMKKLGSRMLLVGSNETHYWVDSQEDENFFCGKHDQQDDLPKDLPISPSQLIEAIGLTALPYDAGLSSTGSCIQRIVQDYQQVLFIRDGANGTPIIKKEYWIDRRAPYLVRKVIFRDQDGQVEMESSLSKYRRLSENGSWLPHVLEVSWPKAKARLQFHIRQWKQFKTVTPTSPQFVTPEKCDS